MFYELCTEESVDDGCLRLPVHLSFIVQETIGDLAPTNLYSTSEKQQLGISFQERVQTGRATPKEGCKGSKIEYIKSVEMFFFFVLCTPLQQSLLYLITFMKNITKATEGHNSLLESWSLK